MTRMSSEKWETQKVYRKEKEIQFDGEKGNVLHSFPCIEKKRVDNQFITVSLKFHLRENFYFLRNFSCRFIEQLYIRSSAFDNLELDSNWWYKTV